MHYYAQDYPGDVVGLIDSQKGLANEYAYTPWGEPESVRESVPNALRFQAREWDAEAGLYYYRNRWYDAQLWRFNSEDPIGGPASRRQQRSSAIRWPGSCPI